MTRLKQIRSSSKLVFPTYIHHRQRKCGFLLLRVISGTVAKRLREFVDKNLMGEGTDKSPLVTADYCQNFNDLFDMCNSNLKTLDQNRPFKTVFKGDKSQMDLLKKMDTYIDKLEIYKGIDSAKALSRHKWPSAWKTTMNSLRNVWNEEKKRCKFIATQRLQQDPLEIFFGQIRKKGGCNRTPTVTQFRAAFRKLLFSTFLPLTVSENIRRTKGNCAADRLSYLFSAHDFIINQKKLPETQSKCIYLVIVLFVSRYYPTLWSRIHITHIAKVNYHKASNCI